MATFSVKIDLENDAFVVDGRPEIEVARLLRNLAKAVTASGLVPGDFTLCDVNGNKVLTTEVEE
jgi:hypothetical protein